MEYSKFIKRDVAYEWFVSYRKLVMTEADKKNFDNAFTIMCERAIDGDSVAQDCVAYFFNKGFDDLAQNYDLYMSWEILAGANGNEFALEKLGFFLDPAINTIVNDQEILVEAMKKGNITKENALSVIGNLICESVVDQLKIDPLKLIKFDTKPVEFSSVLQKKYDNAIEQGFESVIKFLLS